MNYKLVIATPAYSGNVSVEYASSLAKTVTYLNDFQIPVAMHLPKSGSLLVSERNRILEVFWNTDATHLLCVDADLGWPAEAVLHMLNKNKDFLVGIYPARNLDNKFIFKPDEAEDGTLIFEDNLIKAQYVPAGFMLLSRNCIAQMRDKFPELYYSPKDPRAKEVQESTYCLFNTELYEGEFWGEDFVFCRRARQAGIDIWIDPLIQFNHAGTIGRLSDIIEQVGEEKLKTLSVAA